MLTITLDQYLVSFETAKYFRLNLHVSRRQVNWTGNFRWFHFQSVLKHERNLQFGLVNCSLRWENQKKKKEKKMVFKMSRFKQSIQLITHKIKFRLVNVNSACNGAKYQISTTTDEGNYYTKRNNLISKDKYSRSYEIRQWRVFPSHVRTAPIRDADSSEASENLLNIRLPRLR